MNNLYKFNRKAVLVGGVTTLIFAMLFVHTEIILSVKEPVFIILNVLSFVLFWVLLSFLLTQYSVLSILGILSLLAISVLADYHMHIGKNPITIPLILIFWLGLGYVIQPEFFKKYGVAFISVFGLLICYFFYHLFTTEGYGPDDRGSFSKLALVPLPAFIALWGYEQWRWLKTLKSNQANAELALLKSQINPHFFFNTLNNLYGLVVEHSEEAPAVVLKLSDMMRYTIYEGKKDLVKLKDEINYLETYIDLHKIRYQKDVDIRFTHAVDENMEVAPLLFIILLENAFKHGVETMRKDAYAHLSMKTHDMNITFEIENNCNHTESTENSGIGLNNLKRRLEFLYPNNHELTLDKKDSVFRAKLKLTQL